MFLRLLIIIVLLLVGAAVLSYLNPPKDKSQNFLLNGLSVVHSWFNQEEETAAEKIQTTTVYKWQNPDGSWQFSNEPPPPGTTGKITVYRSDTNVLPAPKPPEPAGSDDRRSSRDK